MNPEFRNLAIISEITAREQASLSYVIKFLTLDKQSFLNIKYASTQPSKSMFNLLGLICLIVSISNNQIIFDTYTMLQSQLENKLL
jgi:hypothetical protein